MLSLSYSFITPFQVSMMRTEISQKGIRINSILVKNTNEPDRAAYPIDNILKRNIFL